MGKTVPTGECGRCGKPLDEAMTLFTTSRVLPGNVVEYVCWDCLTDDERKRVCVVRCDGEGRIRWLT